MNKAIIYGNLTRDPELKALPSGGQVATFGIATNRRVKKGDQWESVPEFHNIVTFGKQAETCAQYLKKGDAALVEGRIQTRSWDKDGSKQYRTEVVAEHVQFGARGQGGGDTPRKKATPPKDDKATDPAEDEAYAASQKDSTTGEPAIEYPQEDIDINNIPF